MDLPLYEINSVALRVGSEDKLRQSLLSSTPTAGISVLAGKVTKYLMTRRGSDLMNPQYGCHLLTYTQVPQAELPRFQLELISSLGDCAAYIKGTETGITDNTKRLKSIELINLTYNIGDIKDQVDIHLKITDLSGGTTVLNVPIKN